MDGRVAVFPALVVLAVSALAQGPAPDSGRWYFAISGDSRDCGDLIMPKIAQNIAANQDRTPVAFFWHLGDFRYMYDIDCDILTRKYPSYDCQERKPPLGVNDMDEYLAGAWQDFLERQLRPFGQTKVFLGIGNHELFAGRTRVEFCRTFQKWLTQEPLHGQRRADVKRGLTSTEGDTTYHFVLRGVDFIFLDNADEKAFTTEQITWLSGVLAADAEDPTVKAIIVGMHEPLPYSTGRLHAMDVSCQGRCSGQQVYDMLFRAQNLSAPPEKQKRVFVFASHLHYFEENVYDTPEHQGQVLTGWAVGTGGAEQKGPTIRYGYVLVEVRPDGSIGTQFKEVTRESPPLASGPGAATLTEFCFSLNKSPITWRRPAGACPCGSSR
jgi:hypothetical protein